MICVVDMSSSPRPSERRDLGDLFTRLSRGMIAVERPILEVHGLSMWGYAVLSELMRGPAPTQVELAQQIGADKTRLIGQLDRLEADGLVRREADPSDRRAHRITLTKDGRRRCEAVMTEIRAAEEQLLGSLSTTERRALEKVLPRLLGEPIESLAESVAARCRKRKTR